MNAATVRRIDPGRGAAATSPGNAPEVDAATVMPFHTLPFHTGIRGDRAAPAGAAGRRVAAPPGCSAHFARG